MAGGIGGGKHVGSWKVDGMEDHAMVGPTPMCGGEESGTRVKWRLPSHMWGSKGDSPHWLIGEGGSMEATWQGGRDGGLW